MDEHYDEPYDYLDSTLKKNVSTSFESSLYFYSFSSLFLEYDWNINGSERKTLYVVSFFIDVFLLVIGTVINATLLYSIVAFTRVRETVQHIFIANVAIVDIALLNLAGMISVSINGLEGFGPGMPWHHDKIYLLPIFTEVIYTILTSQLAFMITMLAFDQYMVVVCPVMARGWRTPKNATTACVLLWIIGVVAGVVDGLTFLSPAAMADKIMLIKLSLIIIFLYLVPIGLTLFFNFQVYLSLKSARTATTRGYVNNAHHFTQLQEANGGLPGAIVRAKDLPSTVSLTITFVVCYAIFLIIHLIIGFIWALNKMHHFFYESNKVEILLQIADIGPLLNAALNPLLFAASNPKFWQHMTRAVYVFLQCKGQPFHNQMPISADVDYA